MTGVTAAGTGTFSETLTMRAEATPDRHAFTFLRDGETDEERVSYIDLHRRAQAIAAALREATPAGSRALLLLAPGLDYTCAVFGCFHAGVVGVSAAPPSPKRVHRTLPRLLSIAADAEVTAIVTTAAIRDAAQALLADGPLAAAAWVAIDDFDEDAAWEDLQRSPSALAFMQYTSGSTSDPRGVMLTHRQLLENSKFIHTAFGHDPDTVGFIWLPPYHDMGLIGGILQPVYAGMPTVLMSPIAAMKRPARWLQGIGRYGAHTSGGPNFAYDMCVSKIDDSVCDELDLSSWKVAFNGAEPIRAETIEQFTRKFGRCGFSESAFYPCYGLAEATLMVTGPARDAAPTVRSFDAEALRDGRVAPPTPEAPPARIVGCGTPADGHDVAIVDSETLR